MKLLDLNPRFFAEAGRHGQGLSFDCPHCGLTRLGVAFANPIDGGSPLDVKSVNVKLRHVHEERLYDVPPGFLWKREGDTFETMSLSPSVDASASGHWHGFLKNGEIR